MTFRPHSFRRIVAVATLVGPLLSIATVSDAATLKNGVQTPATEAMPNVVLPKRNDVLVVDWVDTMAARIAIGGVTYPLKGHPPKVFLASGEEVTTVGWLKPGMRTHIEMVVDADGQQHLSVIRVVAVSAP